MDTPQIQYARTSDGVSIAYTTMGAGPLVLYNPGHQLSMQSFLSPGPGHWMGRDLDGWTRLTTFDHAGIGASQRDVSDFSLDAQVRAIEAVADRLDDGQFTLIGSTTACPSAALYAARHPDRVRELACLAPVFPGAERLAAEMRENWSLSRRLHAGQLYPEGPVSTQRWRSNAMRESMTAEVCAAYLDEFARADLREIYRRIPVRTLFYVNLERVKKEALALASLVPDCRVAFGDPRISPSPAKVILEFMGFDTAQVNPSAAPAGDTHGTAVILFTDIVDSTPLTERMGDAAFRALSRSIDERVRAAMREHGGTPVEGKVLGDGVMGVFGSAAQAIGAARACVELGRELPMHIGLHAGDVLSEGTNVYGGAVNIASRICGLCTPGEILVSATVRELARTSGGVTFEDRGEQTLKGIDDPVRVFAVREQT